MRAKQCLHVSVYLSCLQVVAHKDDEFQQADVKLRLATQRWVDYTKSVVTLSLDKCHQVIQVTGMSTKLTPILYSGLLILDTGSFRERNLTQFK